MMRMVPKTSVRGILVTHEPESTHQSRKKLETCLGTDERKKYCTQQAQTCCRPTISAQGHTSVEICTCTKIPVAKEAQPEFTICGQTLVQRGYKILTQANGQRQNWLWFHNIGLWMVSDSDLANVHGVSSQTVSVLPQELSKEGFF